MLIDTHCHLDAAEFGHDRMEVARRAIARGVRGIVVPAVDRGNFGVVRELAHAFEGGAYALGIHPLFVANSSEEDLHVLRAAVQDALGDPRFVAIGEIGLDFFVQQIATGAARDKQERFYAAQLELADEFGLPVLLHVRRSQDIILKYLRRRPAVRGIAHAFNGSEQQADAFVELGFALGIGGAMTFARALRIRRHAVRIGLDHLVLETDSPDIPPAWLEGEDRRNTPDQVDGVAAALAELRQIPKDAVVAETGATALRILPRLADALSR
jgi:TatD DNase family protein